MMEVRRRRRSCASGEYIELELRPSTDAPPTRAAESGIELPEVSDSDRPRFSQGHHLLPSHHGPRVVTNNDLRQARVDEAEEAEEEEEEHEAALREDSSFGSQQSSSSSNNNYYYYYNYYWGSSNHSEEKLDRWSSSSRCSLDSLPNKASSCFRGPSPPPAKASRKKKKKGWWAWKALANKLFWGLESPAPAPPSLVVEPNHHVPDVFGTYQPAHLPVENPSGSTPTHTFGAVKSGSTSTHTFGAVKSGSTLTHTSGAAQPIISPPQYCNGSPTARADRVSGHGSGSDMDRKKLGRLQDTAWKLIVGGQSGGDNYIWHRCFARPIALYKRNNNNNNNNNHNHNNNNNNNHNNNNNNHNNHNNKSKSKSSSSTPLAKSPIREHYYAHQAGGPGYTYLAAKYRHLACTSSCPGSILSSPVHHQYSGPIPTNSGSSHIAIQGAIDHCKRSQYELA